MNSVQLRERALVVAIFLHGCATGAPQPSLANSRPDFSTVEAILSSDIASRRIPFAEVAVFEGDRLVYNYRGGFVDEARTAPLPSTALYRIASLSKPITAFAALRLIEAGKLGLDNPVSQYLPELATLDVVAPCPAEQSFASVCTTAARNRMTIRHLLAHTSGLSYPLASDDALERIYLEAGLTNGAIETPYELRDLASRLAPLPLANEPGGAWRYGLSSDVLGRILEIVTGRSLDDVIREQVLEPLGMNNTFFFVPADARANVVPIFQRSADGDLHIVPSGEVRGGAFLFSSTFPFEQDARYRSAGGGLVSSLDDVSTFARMLAAGGVHRGRRLLSRDLFAEFRRDQTQGFGTGIEGTGFGLGIAVRLTPTTRGTTGRIGELSWSGIFFTTFWVDPATGVSGVFLSQMRPDQRPDTARRVQNAVFRALESPA